MSNESTTKALEVSNIIQQIEKTLRAYKTYDEGHPVLLEFETKLSDKFTEFLSKEGNFSIEVKPYQFLFSEEVVYENTDKQDNFSFKFHQDGIRHLMFLEGLTLEEVRHLLLIMRVNFQSNEYADEDTITLLWKAGMRHIKYQMVETFINQGEETVDTDKAIREASLAFMKDSSPASIDIDTSQRKELESRQLRPKDIEELEALLSSEIGYDYKVDEDTKKAGEIEEEGGEVIKRILLLLLRMLLSIGDDQDFLSTATVLQRVIESMVRTRQYHLVARVLGKMEDLADPVKNPDPRKAGLIANLLKGLAAPHLVGMVAKDVGSLDDDQIKGLREFVVKLPVKCADDLFEIFKSESNSQIRNALLPALSMYGDKKLELYAQSIAGADMELALFLLELFANIGVNKASLQIKRSFRHIDAKVRARALDLSLQADNDLAKSLSLLGMKDENKQIRMKSLNVLINIKDVKGAKSILDHIGENSFDEKTRDEKLQFYVALARLAGKPSIKFFAEELDKGILERSTKNIDRQVCAVMALKELGNSEAKEIVEKREQKKLVPKEVKETCRSVLQKWPK